MSPETLREAVSDFLAENCSECVFRTAGEDLESNGRGYYCGHYYDVGIRNIVWSADECDPAQKRGKIYPYDRLQGKMTFTDNGPVFIKNS